MALVSICRMMLFGKRVIDRVGTVDYVPPGEVLERVPSAFLANGAGRIRILKHPRDGRRELFTIAVADEQPITAMANQGGYRTAPAPDDGLAEEPRLEIDEAEGLDTGRMHQERTFAVPAPLLRFRNIRSGDDA